MQLYKMEGKHIQLPYGVVSDEEPMDQEICYTLNFH